MTSPSPDGMLGETDIAGLDRSFPKKRISAGGIIRNAASELLIVKPTYREGWLLPGGICEAGESPASALIREIHEELRITATIDTLRCVDYLSPTDGFGEALHFLFECRALDTETVGGIRIDGREISGYRFCNEAEAKSLLVPAIARRLGFVREGGTYCEDGRTAPALRYPGQGQSG